MALLTVLLVTADSALGGTGCDDRVFLCPDHERRELLVE